MEHSQLYYWFEKILKYNQPSRRDEPSPIKSFKQKLIITCYIKTLELTFLFATGLGDTLLKFGDNSCLGEIRKFFFKGYY